MSPELAPRVDPWAYELEEKVGSGSSGSVWRARDSDGRVIALKVGHGPGERRRFASEAARLFLAASPALPALFDVGLVPATRGPRELTSAGAPYLALEWLPGASIDPTSLPAGDRLELALIVARDLGRAIADLHAAGWAHGDVKPFNIRFDPARGEARPVDFGLCEAVGERRVLGATPRYLAPECRNPGAQSDAGARDLWAFGITLAEIASAEVALSSSPAEAAGARSFDPRLEAVIRPLLRNAAGARPGADWVERQATATLGTEQSPEARRARAVASLRRAYTSTRRPWLERVVRGDTLDVRVTGVPERWLREAELVLARVALVRGNADRGGERSRHVVDDLSPLDQERMLLKLLGPSEQRLGTFTSPTDAELIERLERAITEQSPRSVSGLVLAPAPHDLEQPGADDPVELAIALGEGPARASLLDRAERFVMLKPEARSLGLVLARALCLQQQLGRALAALDRVGGPEALVEAAEIARRADDEDEARRRLEQLDLSKAPRAVQARAAAILARLELKAGRVRETLEKLETAPESVAVLEVRSMALIRIPDLRAAERCLDRARHLTDRAEELARLEFLTGRIAHARHNYEASLESFARASDYALRAGAALEEATYLSGVAAAATELGQLSQALHAAGRALLLYEHLGKPEQAARAALSRAGVFLIAGAREEAVEAAQEALGLAQQTADVRCQAYAHLALAETALASPHVASEHLTRARQLLGTLAADDLRVAALELALGHDQNVTACDARASDTATSAEVRLVWWGARARELSARGAPPPSTHVVRQLATLVSAHAGVGVKGPAFAAGARLSAALADGELSRRFTRLASESLSTLRRHAPRQLAASLGLESWTLGLDAPAALSVAPEQVRDVDTLVRALTTKNNLRSLLNQVLDALVLWTGVERGLLLLTAPGGRLVPRAARNLLRTDLGPAQLELSYSLAERAIATREPVVAVDAAGELPEHHASVHALKLRSLLAIPLFFKGETLGVVYLDDRVRTGAFGPQELSWVRLVASIASVAIGDARDQLRLRRAARRAERAEKKLATALESSEARRDHAERELAREGRARFRYERIVGESPAIAHLLGLLDRITVADVPVLILGESGTGKELVARALHENGPRASAPFVSENCSAIPETLLESTLFGHVRGAFTGAARGHAGLFSVAHQGTLFLDEIGEMSLGMQAKLLRVLETGEVRPLGSEKNQHVDVRVIGATQRDLEAMVRSGTFREDLFYRLNVVSVRVPPLRERRSDIVPLMRHFLTKHATGSVPLLSESAAKCLEGYAWPGNVRELENEARRVLVMASQNITLEHLSPRIQGRPQSAPSVHDLNLRSRVDQLEAELVRTALDKTQGNQTRAAELLGLSRFGLQKMMKRLHIGKPES